VGARELARLRADNKWYIRARNGAEEKDAASPVVGGRDEEVGLWDNHLSSIHLQNRRLTCYQKYATNDDGSTDEGELIAAIDSSVKHAASLASSSLAPSSLVPSSLPSSSLAPAPLPTAEHLAQSSSHPSTTSPTTQHQPATIPMLTPAEARKARRRIHHPTTGKFPSEMKLEDCKLVLGISEPTYQAIRTAFLTICETSNIQRKKGCGIWADAKRRLIDSVPALRSIFEAPMTATEKERKALAVDLICQDRTKNLRRNATRMELRDAKKVLGLDPAGVTRVRKALMGKLKNEGFRTKTEAGERRWKELRDEWVAEEGLGGKGVQGEKACDVICADVMKRVNDQRALKRKEKKAEKPHDGQKAEKPLDGQRAGEDDEDEGMGEMSEGGDEEGAVESESPASMNRSVEVIQPGASAGYGYNAYSTTYTPYGMGPYATSQNSYSITTASNSHSAAGPPHLYALAAASNPYISAHTTAPNLPPTSTDPASEHPDIDPALFYGS